MFGGRRNQHTASVGLAVRMTLMIGAIAVVPIACSSEEDKSDNTSPVVTIDGSLPVLVNASAGRWAWSATADDGRTNLSATGQASAAFTAMAAGDTSSLSVSLDGTLEVVATAAGGSSATAAVTGLVFDASAYDGTATDGFAAHRDGETIGCTRDADELICSVSTKSGSLTFTNGKTSVVGDPLPTADVDALVAALNGAQPIAYLVELSGSSGCLFSLAANGTVSSVKDGQHRVCDVGEPIPDTTLAPETTLAPSTTVLPTTTLAPTTTLQPTTTTAQPTTTSVKPTTTTTLRPTTTTTVKPTTTTSTVPSSTSSTSTSSTSTSTSSTSTSSTSTSSTSTSSTSTLVPSSSTVPPTTVAPATTTPTEGGGDSSGDGGGSGTTVVLLVLGGIAAAGVGLGSWLRLRRR